jgi:hypothetical protein
MYEKKSFNNSIDKEELLRQIKAGKLTLPSDYDDLIPTYSTAEFTSDNGEFLDLTAEYLTQNSGLTDDDTSNPFDTTRCPYLYHEVKRPGDGYTDNPPGGLNPSRIVRREPAWLNIVSDQEASLEKYTLFFAWSSLFDGWLGVDYLEIKELLIPLQRKGEFNIYGLTHNYGNIRGTIYISSYDTDLNIAEVSETERLESERSSKKLKSLIAQKTKTPIDNLLELDYHWIDCLRDETKSPSERTLSVSFYADLIKSAPYSCSPKDLTKIHSRLLSLETAYPPLSKIIDDCDNEQALAELKNMFPHLEVVQSFNADEQALINISTQFKHCEDRTVEDRFRATVMNQDIDISRLPSYLKRLHRLSYNNLIFEKELSKQLLETVSLNYIESYETLSLLTGIPIADLTPLGGLFPTSSVISQDREIIDADTEHNPDLTYQISRIFYAVDDEDHPQPNGDRVEIYHDVVINPNPCSPATAFELQKTENLRLVPCQVLASTINTYDLAKSQQPTPDTRRLHAVPKMFTLNHLWQPIPSRYTHEMMTHYHMDPPAQVEFMYSQTNHQYFIRSKQGPITSYLDYLLEVPLKGPELCDLPSEVFALVEHYSNEYNQVAKTALTLDVENPTGQDYLNAIRAQRKGACRQLVVSFKEEMKRKYPDIPVHIPYNQLHTYAEVFWNGQWIPCNLGGYSANIELDETQNPHQQSSIETSPTNTSSLLENHFYLELQKILSPVTQLPETFDAACESFFNNHHSNQLFQLSSNDAVDTLVYGLQKHCVNHGYPVYYIHSPKDLICSADTIQAVESPEGLIQGTKIAGPGGDFHDFLMQHQDSNNVIIIINHANFPPNEIVNHNSAIDIDPHKRTADGTPIPLKAKVFSLTNKNSRNYYNRPDFLRRFGCFYEGPAINHLLRQNPLPSLPFVEESMVSSAGSITEPAIDLFHAPDWRERLIGNWILHHQALVFERGPLAQRLKDSSTITLNGDLKDNEDYQRFWRQALLFGEIPCAGGPIKLPKHLRLKRRNEYHWPTLTANLTIVEGLTLQKDALTLNAYTISDFFQRYLCDNTTHSIDTINGWLEERKGQTLHINLTRTLPENAFAMLLSAYQDPIVLHCAPGVVLPEVLNISSASSSIALITSSHEAAPASSDIDYYSKSMTFIVSEDPAATVAWLEQQHRHLNMASFLVIDVSELNPEDLLDRLESQPSEFIFTQYPGLLERELARGRNIILTGTFSKNLADALAPLLLKLQSNPEETPGKLLLVTKRAMTFPYLNAQRHDVSWDMKLELLKNERRARIAPFTEEEISILSPNNQEYNFNQLRSLLISQRIRQDLGDIHYDGWEGLEHLSRPNSLVPFSWLDREKDTNDFIEKRIKAVNTAFKHSPFIFLAGTTGAGKTRFVQEYLKTSKHNTLYQQKDTLPGSLKRVMREWASDKTPGKIKTLFFDEATLIRSNMTLLNCLFNENPALCIDGEIFEITPEHIMICAGNDISYGDERHLASFFADHGCVVIFDPLSLAFIHEKILTPLCEDTALDNKTWIYSEEYLFRIYEYLFQLSVDNTLISPRELEMITLFVLSYHLENPTYNWYEFFQAVEHYAYTITAPLVPEKNQQEFEQAFKPKRPFPRNTPTKVANFTLTQSREESYWLVSDALRLHEQRREGRFEKISGGLGGITLEGSSSAGKSDLLKSILIARGYRQLSLSEPNDGIEKVFYYVPAGMPEEEKERFLSHDINGAVVIAEEINASKRMEMFFNALQMGRTQDGKEMSKRPLILATQNSAFENEGRNVASNATERRTITLKLSDYTDQEFQQILEDLEQPLTPPYAEAVVKAGQRLAQETGKTICLGDLLKLVPEALSLQKNTASTSVVIEASNDRYIPCSSSFWDEAHHVAPTYPTISSRHVPTC